MFNMVAAIYTTGIRASMKMSSDAGRDRVFQ
jgi:hypothetical protein